MTSRGQNPKIVKTSPPPTTSSFSHRRPTADRSVSLRHSPSKARSANSDPGTKSSFTNSPSSLIPLAGRDSSGESSNAEKWFEKSNNEVRDTSTSFADNEPPFFMRNSSSESPPDVLNQQDDYMTGVRAESLPLRTGLLMLGTDGSSTEDFRGVIDDLTVENKKLKRKLKKYEKLHDAHLKDEKLFEVRVHGLPPDKKRELEETLRKFASGLDTTGAKAFPNNGYASLLPMLKGSKATSSQVSLQHTDSAYASMSSSGQGSSSNSHVDGKNKMTPSRHLASQRQNIQNYLHDIPEGLLPRQNPTNLSERATKKLVVRRMEQLFAGKGATELGHQQSLQQQEVSQSAAKADRSAIEASGQSAGKEGYREAHIMSDENGRRLESQQHQLRIGDAGAAAGTSLEHALRSSRSPSSRSQAQDQRPTRPLDLDPHRAQVSTENIRYMRHLGFSPRDPRSNGSPEEGHEWIYLNFLINMAQLHTINVTPDFVRKALDEMSDKFEISDDGRRVRWRGGLSVTRTSSNGGSAYDRTADDPAHDGQSPRKRIKLSSNGVRSTASGMRSGNMSRRSQLAGSRHMYTPLFFHRGSGDEMDDSESPSEDESMSPHFPLHQAADSSAMTSSGVRTTSGMPLGAAKKKQKKHDDGPIIFYNNARFCTDLSGDRKASAPTANAPAYHTASSIAVGQRRSPGLVAEKRGPLAQASELPEPMDLGDNPIPESLELAFPQRSPLGSSSSTADVPIDLEVTGIGGVWHADNFAISVNSRLAHVNEEQVPPVSMAASSKHLPPRLAEILRPRNEKSVSHPAVHKQIVASRMQKLPPSQLPDALGFMPSDEESEDEAESEADEMSDVESNGDSPPSAAPQPVELPYTSEDESEEYDDDDDDESDGEVDFLATARQMDPEAVRQKEREYDAQYAERLAEEIPAGSSAATAGGGSGFASPNDNMTLEEHKRASREARAKAAHRDRSRAREVYKMQDASDSGQDQDMSDVAS